jgi:GNAT superfamily N-acetyltransferase
VTVPPRSDGAAVSMRTVTVAVRPIEPGDKAKLVAAYERLSDASRYRRFLSPHGQLSKSELRYLTEVDHHDHEALVAFDPVTGEGVGVARYVRDSRRSDSAEIAVAVADEWQGRGVGTTLLHGLADRARDEGIRRLTALMLAENDAMAHLLGDLGETRVLEVGQGTVELAVDLPARGASPELASWLRSAAHGALRLP